MQSIKDHETGSVDDLDIFHWYYRKEYETFSDKYQHKKHFTELRDLLGIPQPYSQLVYEKQQNLFAAFFCTFFASYAFFTKVDNFIRLLNVQKLELVKKVLR